MRDARGRWYKDVMQVSNEPGGPGRKPKDRAGRRRTFAFGAALIACCNQQWEVCKDKMPEKAMPKPVEAA